MKKFWVVVIMCWMFLITPTFGVEVKANLLTFDVYFNGVKIENENRQFPLLVYKDITTFSFVQYVLIDN